MKIHKREVTCLMIRWLKKEKLGTSDQTVFNYLYEFRFE